MRTPLTRDERQLRRAMAKASQASKQAGSSAPAGVLLIDGGDVYGTATPLITINGGAP